MIYVLTLLAVMLLAGCQSLIVRAYLQRYAGISPLTAVLLLLGVRAENALGDAKQAALYAAELRKYYPTAKEIESL